MIAFVIGFYFIFLGAIAFYFLLAYFYRKLVKYFLANLYRVPGSLWLMTYLYAFRPFLKGLIHAYLYDSNSIQLLTLALIEIMTCFILILAQVRYDMFISRLLFMLEIMFFFILAQLNIFLLLSQFTESPKVVDNYLLVSFILLSALTIARLFSILLYARFA